MKPTNAAIMLTGQATTLSMWKSEFESQWLYKKFASQMMGKADIRSMGHGQNISHTTCREWHNQVYIKKDSP